MFTIERSRSLRGDMVIRDANTYHVVAVIDHMSKEAEDLLGEFSPTLALAILTGDNVPIADEIVARFRKG